MKIRKEKELTKWYNKESRWGKPSYDDSDPDSDILHDTSIWGRNSSLPPRSTDQALTALTELEDRLKEFDNLKSQLKQERALRKKAEKEIKILKEMEEERKAAEDKAAEAKAAEAKAVDPDDDGMLGSGIFVAKPV